MQIIKAQTQVIQSLGQASAASSKVPRCCCQVLYMRQENQGSLMHVQQWLEQAHHYWNCTGGKDHIFLSSHDEGSCWVPEKLRLAFGPCFTVVHKISSMN